MLPVWIAGRLSAVEEMKCWNSSAALFSRPQDEPSQHTNAVWIVLAEWAASRRCLRTLVALALDPNGGLHVA